MIVEASSIIFSPEQAISDYCCFFFLIKIAEIITPVPEIAITTIWRINKRLFWKFGLLALLWPFVFELILTA
jgi:hypothetical protein